MCTRPSFLVRSVLSFDLGSHIFDVLVWKHTQLTCESACTSERKSHAVLCARRKLLFSLFIFIYLKVPQPQPSFPLNLRHDLSPLITLLIARGYCKAQWHSWGPPAHTPVSILSSLFLSLSLSFSLVPPYVRVKCVNPYELLAVANYKVHLITTYVHR